MKATRVCQRRVRKIVCNGRREPYRAEGGPGRVGVRWVADHCRVGLELAGLSTASRPRRSQPTEGGAWAEIADRSSFRSHLRGALRHNMNTLTARFTVVVLSPNSFAAAAWAPGCRDRGRRTQAHDAANAPRTGRGASAGSGRAIKARARYDPEGQSIVAGRITEVPASSLAMENAPSRSREAQAHCGGYRGGRNKPVV